MYSLFTGDRYYPSGGWHDYRGSFESLEKALIRLSSLKYDWWHIVYGGRIVESGWKELD